MKDFKISKKLFYAFGSLCLLILVICGVALYAIIMSNIQANQLYNKNLIAVDQVGKMRETFQKERALTRSLILFDSNSDTYKSTVSSLQASSKEMEDAFSQYEFTIDQQENRELFDATKKFYTNDYAVFKADLKVMTDKNVMQASMDKLNSGAKIVDTLTNYFNKMESYNTTYAKAAINGCNQAYFITLIIVIPIMLICLIWSMLLIKYLNKMIAQKIVRVADAAKELAVGKTNIELEADSKDELGQLVDAFNFMIDNIKQQANVAKKLSEGDLTIEHTPHSNEDTMGNALVKTIDGLDQIFSEVRTATLQVNAGAEQVSQAAQALAQGATEQASSVEELAASINDVSSQVTTNAANASRARDLAVKAGEGVSNGSMQMNEMVTAMNEINQSSSEISKIIKVIDDIAFQTNILALNAAVEAARAGEAGKGFAVVADEVRNLAAKSADAAKTTTVLIENSIIKVEDGTKIADSTAVSLKEIVESVDEVSELIHLIDKASSQQAAALSQISLGIDQISSVVQTNSATAEESAAASEELSGQASMLEKLLSTIKLKSLGKQKIG